MKLSSRAAAPFHGGLDYEEIRLMGIDPESVVDFSSNINPFFPSSRLLAGACAGACDYPDAGYSELRGAVAEFHGVVPEQVFAGNGASEIVHLLCRCLPAGASVLIPVPTFSEYERAAVICGARVILCPAPDGMRFDPQAIARAIKDSRPDLVFLCNPNNPTGLNLSRAAVETVVSSANGAVVVIDESYADFVENREDYSPVSGAENVVILRSLTKFYGLAGLRIGYAVSSPPVVAALNGVRPPWNVNSVAAAAAASIFSLPRSVCDESRARLFSARNRLVKALEDAGKKCLPTDTGFFMVETPHATAAREKLLRKGVAVRDCSSFGLASHIRISARPEKDCGELIKQWKAADREG